MQTLDKGNIKQAVVGILFLTLITGCAEWNSHPVVVQQNFGNAVNNMVKNQTLYPEHGQNDNPTLGLDGQKAQGVIRAYRQGASEMLEESKQGPSFDVSNVGK
ncbi:MAG TPA: hypothetical protein VIF10_06555 [Methylobacter sp.]|jgi:TolA-binding protein